MTSTSPMTGYVSTYYPTPEGTKHVDSGEMIVVEREWQLLVALPMTLAVKQLDAKMNSRPDRDWFLKTWRDGYLPFFFTNTFKELFWQVNKYEYAEMAFARSTFAS